eukprot:TRINITY_DN5132_c0_g1_i2.p1 TRINITY_DN5132_c0_g1~~TRINITY_DN5132_c0_g1_i2.p1  ORF type:complete len:673 (+),score=156.27 TRINITY_DN5132_c0_g1_i2:60-2078(+)
MDGTSGQLYLKIQDGSEDIRGKPLHCTCSIIGQTKKVKTKVNKIRYWNEEVLFGVVDRVHGELVIKVKQPSIGTNKLRGIATISLSEVPDYNPTEMWVDLSEGSGRLHVILVFTPFSYQSGVVSAVTKRLPSFRVHLERTTYFPGETICGYLIWNVSSVRKIRAVRLKFSGCAKTNWTEQEGSGDSRRTVYYSAVCNYFNSIATVWGAPRGQKTNYTIEPGTYFWPFTYTLPAALPPSMAGTHGKIHYFVQAYVDIPMAIDKTVTVPLEICVQYNNVAPPIQLISQHTKDGLTKKKHNIQVAAVANDIMYIGRTNSLPVTITNLSEKPIKKLEVEMVGVTRFYARRNGHGRWHKRKYRLSVLKTNIEGNDDYLLNPGSQWNGDIAVSIPDHLRPTILPDICPIIHQDYRLKLAAVTKGNTFTKGKSKIKFEVSVGWIHPMLEQMHIYEPAPSLTPQNQIGIFQQQITTEWYQHFAPKPNYDHSKDYCIGSQFDISALQQVEYPEQWGEDEENTDISGVPFDQVQYEGYDPNQGMTPQQGNYQNQGMPPQNQGNYNQGMPPPGSPQQGHYNPNQGMPPQNQGHYNPNQEMPPQNQGNYNQGMPPPGSPQQGHYNPNQGMPPQNQGNYNQGMPPPGSPQQGHYNPHQGMPPPGSPQQGHRNHETISVSMDLPCD